MTGLLREAVNVHDLPADFTKVDIAISYMVMEHVEDDVGFIQKIAQYVKPGGNIILAVPDAATAGRSRTKRWAICGATTAATSMRFCARPTSARCRCGRSAFPPSTCSSTSASGWSLAAARPLKRGRANGSKPRQRHQGYPWKTVFPSWVRIILNRWTLYPLFVIQRIFYRTGLGVVMMGMGRVS